MSNSKPGNEPSLEAKTNYERIRSMTPLQMADWLFHMLTLCDCCAKHYICGRPEDQVTDEYCMENVLLWLGQKETINNATRRENKVS